MDNKVRCCLEPHSDFSLEWDSNFEGSILTSKLLEGRVVMKYSSVPYFIYILSKPIENFDFLGEKARQEILNCEEVSFADCSYKDIPKKVESDAEFYGSIFAGVFKDRKTREEKKIEENRLNSLRERTDIFGLIEGLRSKGIKHNNLEYSGAVPDSSEYPRLIHILTSPERETYISQYWQGMNILRTQNGETKMIIKDTIRLYGVVVSGALRTLLEKQ